MKRKINLIGKNKKAIIDNQSMASFSLSRKSSFTSNISALAFSSPSPNLNQISLNGGSAMISNSENFILPISSLSLENQQDTEIKKKDEFQNINLANDFIFVEQKTNGFFFINF